MADPMAVVFKTADGGMHEVWVPSGFAFAVTNGGILVIHEQTEVVGVVSARPLQGGEANAPEVHQQGDRPDDPVDERGRDADSVVPGTEAGDGSGADLGAPEGAELHQPPGGGHGDDCSCGCSWCRAGDCEDCADSVIDGDTQLWPVYSERRVPGPDDAPGVTV